MKSQALWGVNLPCGWYRVSGQPPSTGGQVHTSSYTHPMKPQHCPYNPNPIKYDQDNQATDPVDTSPKLDEANKKCIQQIVGSFLYYACAVNPTILMALSAIAS
jgi:hypothetical protein